MLGAPAFRTGGFIFVRDLLIGLIAGLIAGLQPCSQEPYSASRTAPTARFPSPDSAASERRSVGAFRINEGVTSVASMVGFQNEAAIPADMRPEKP
ncbi:MAG: hypothetical protein CMJ54_01160 [Planctomycetaceae bacterium]|nr:hypothetical protein [Planctomycetaceae bacterium]